MDHLGQHCTQAVADPQQHLAVLRRKGGLDPAGVGVVCVVQPQRAAQAHGYGVDLLHPHQHACVVELQHGGHVVRWPVAKPHHRARAVVRQAGAPQLGRVEPVMGHKGRVKAAHAGVTTAQRHLGDGQVGVGQQLFGRQQAAGLQVLQRRDAKLRFKNAPQMAVTDAQPGGQLLHR